MAMPYFTQLQPVTYYSPGFASVRVQAKSSLVDMPDYYLHGGETFRFTRISKRASRRLHRDSRKRPLPYLHYGCFEKALIGPHTANPLSFNCGEYVNPAFSHPTILRTYNKAFERFVEKVRKQVNGGEFIGELGKTASSIVSLTKPFLLFFQAVAGLRKADLSPAFKLLRASHPVTGSKQWRRVDRWSQRKAFFQRLRNDKSLVKDSDRAISALWLEYQYGLGPAIRDVFDFLDLLEKAPPSGLYSARARDEFSGSSRPSGQVGWYVDRKCQVKFHIQARVSVQNATDMTLEQFGVFNPASTAWNLLPFSFIVDWFVNINQYLSAFSAFSGLTLHDSFVSEKRSAASTELFRDDAPWGVTNSYSFDGYMLRRVLGIIGPSLVLNPNPLGLQRGLNAIALLVNIGGSAAQRQAVRSWS